MINILFDTTNTIQTQIGIAQTLLDYLITGFIYASASLFILTFIASLSDDLPQSSPILTPQPQLETLNVRMLRKYCQQAGIRWSNQYGQGKHLRKQEMISLLLQLDH